jgi:hypothetical protein
MACISLSLIWQNRILAHIVRFIAIVIMLSLTVGRVDAQHEYDKWHFGNSGGLDLLSNPPTVLSNGQTTVSEGVASISDGAGNLLLYTDGENVWTATHTLMANGTGLLGYGTTAQAAIILKQPSSNFIYYIFTLQSLANGGLFGYSIVDMSLAAGYGSVTVKNVTVSAGNCEAMSSTHHCNGTDYWILVRQSSNSVFRAYQFNAMGLNTTVVTSSIGTNQMNGAQTIKFSPNGGNLARQCTPTELSAIMWSNCSISTVVPEHFRIHFHSRPE